MKETILVIEDDASIARGLELNLALEGYQPIIASNGEQGLRLAQKAQPSLILLDLVLPERDGFAVMRAIRAHDLDTPILVLSARRDEADKLLGFSLGADDYVTKPFSLPELLARIRTALRRHRKLVADAAAVYRFANVVIDFPARRLMVNQQVVDTTAREFELLRFFVTHENQVVTREQVLRNVWGRGAFVSSRTVDNFVGRLRQKIEPDPSAPQHVETVRGVGYRFSVARPGC